MKTWIIILLAALTLSGCHQGPRETTYLVASMSQELEGGITMTLTILRMFERKQWCEDERDSMIKDDYTAECRPKDPALVPMFEGKPMGRWYARELLGGFSPTILYFDFNPPVGDEIMYRELAYEAPHVLKFAALESAPAKVQIFSPTAEVPWGDAAKKNPVIFEKPPIPVEPAQASGNPGGGAQS